MQLCCIFLLLFAQQSALTHAAWHALVGSTGPAQHVAAAPAHDTHSDDAAACVFDAAYGQVLGAGLGGAPAVVHQPLAHGAPAHWHRSFTTPQFLAPLSRGPPSLR